MLNPKKGLIISLVALLTAILIGANAACVMFFDTITTYLCGSGINFEMGGLSETLAASDDLIREIQEEGSVLVKNDDNCLPLTKDELSRVNVFGWRHIDNGWIAGASGSVFGNNKSNLERVTTLLEGFEASNIEWNTNLTKMYEDFYNIHDGKCLEVGEKYYAVSEPDASYYTEELINDAKEFSNVAIVVIGRNGGEGADLPLYQQVRKADGTIEKRTDRNYLELTVEEEDMVRIAAENFEKTIVLIDSVYACSYDFLDKYDIEACLWVSGGGQAGAYSIPKILSGKVNPSGKLTYTVPYDFRDDPSYYNGSSVGGAGAHASYVEDIYVGYRWFETADAEGYWNERTRTFDKALEGGGSETVTKTGYDAVVQYPFGHGLSYTDFEWTVDEFTSTDTVLTASSVISVDVTVTNVGEKKGKEVVQLYATPPYTDGGIEKSAVNLVAFDKTIMLRPGESQTLTLSFTLSDIASYDCYDKNGNGFAGYELEAGEYVVSLRKDAHNVVDAENASITYNLSSGIKIEVDPVTGAKVENRFTGDTAYSGMPIDGTGSDQGQIPLMTRADFAGTFPTKRTSDRTGSKVNASKVYLYEPVGDEILTEMPTQGDGTPGKYLFYTKEDGSPANDSELRTGKGLVINKELMMELGNPDNYDSEKWNEVLNQLSINDLKILTKCGGYRTEHIVSVGKMYCFDNDGGAGMLRHINTNDAINPNREQWSLFGTTSMTAATWNTDLYYAIGNAIAAEGALSGINGWYSPSCNLVRSPFGGRGSEYGSEDPLIAGMTAAEAVRGATTNGLYTYVKHFAVNQSESGRSGKFTWLSEQSLRELYLKTFQITVQHGKTNGIMTAMNRLGAVWTGGNHALLNDILRDEWGFKGCVITDYVDPKTNAGAYGWYKQGIYAGNDLFLSNASTRNNLTLGGWEDDPTYIGFVRQACKNILYSRANAYYISQTTEVESGSKIDSDMIVVSEQPFAWWVVPLAGLDIVILGGILLLLLSLFEKKGFLKILTIIIMVAAIVLSGGYSYLQMAGNQLEETTVEAMMIKQLPTKTEYWEGELFDPTGIILVVQYSDGTLDENVTEGFDWDLKDPLTADNDEVKISMGTKAKYVEIQVNVRTPVSLTVLENPDRLVYAAGEKFSPDGLQLLATYDDGSERVITDGFMYPSTRLQEGTEYVTIRYNGKSIDLPITVTKVAKSVVVTSGPLNTTYMAGQFFDPTGMVIIATFEDGTSMDITEQINMSTKRLQSGDTKLVFNVLGQTFEQAVTVTSNPHVKANVYAEIPETCTEDGKRAYVTCSHCDKFFTDEYLAYEITDLTIPKHHILAASEADPSKGIQVRKCIRCDSAESESPVVYYNFTKADIIDSANTKMTDTAGSSSKNIQNANQFAYRNQYMLNFKQEDDGVQFTFTADKAGRVVIVLKMSSAYFKTIHRGDGDRWTTGDMQLNKVANIKFNGNLIRFADNVILYGADNLKGSVAGTTEGNQTYANTVNWQYVTFEVDAVEGDNVISVQTKACTDYPDINNLESGYSSFALDTAAIYGDIFFEEEEEETIEISDTIKEFVHEFTSEDQTAENTNPPEGRYLLTHHDIKTATSKNILKALALASGGDYLTHFYGGAAVTKTFTSTIEGKATVVLKAASGYITRMENFSTYETGDMIFNKIMKITVNGKDVVFGDDVVLKGNTTYKDYTCMGVWTTITFEMDVKIGENTIVFTSLFPDDGSGNPLYVDPGKNGTQSSFQLDNMMLSMGTHEHSFGEWTKADANNHTRSCICGEKETAAHSFDDGVETKAPTHLEVGEKTYTCSGCSATRTEEIAKIAGHSFGEWSKVDDASHARTCECGETETAPHGWNAGEETKAPTHLEVGEMTYTCPVCSATKTEEIAKIADHNFGKWSKLDDNNHARTCECGETETAPHGWNAGEETKAPTHLEAGETTYTCSDCSATKTEEIAKIADHSFGKWSKVDDESHSRTCECGETETAPHGWDVGVTTKEPTEEEEGIKLYTCDDCGHTKSVSIGTLSHTHTFAAEWSHDGNYHWYATTCGHDSVEGVVTKIAHSFGEGVETKPATHLEAGEMTYTCSECSAIKTEEIAKIAGHSFGKWSKVDDASHSRACECGETETAPHAWNAGEETKAPTHLEAGEMTYTCSDCSATKIEEIAKIAGHSFSEWSKVDDESHSRTCECGETETAPHGFDDGVVTKEPTEEEEGVKTYTCSTCGHTKTEAIDKLESGDISASNTSFTYDFTNADQSAQNNSNPPSNRNNLTYHNIATATSNNIKKALALANNGDYLTHFYGGAAVTKTFTSSVSGKATVTFKIASGYITYSDSGFTKYQTGDMIVNKILKFTVNGVDIVLGDDVVLKGDTTKNDYSCMGLWTDVNFEIDLKAGVNTIVLTSIFPDDGTGKALYNDNGSTGTQSSFQLDTMTVNLLSAEYDLTEENDSFTHNFTAQDQTAQNDHNPPSDRVNVNYVSTATASSTAQKATKLATNEDYVSHFYGGAAVTKSFTAESSGKATVTFKIASGYLTKAASGVYATGDMVVNKVMRITVNGVDVVFGDDLVLKGDTSKQSYACMANWTYITFEMDVKRGLNTIVLTSLFPEDADGNALYNDPGANGTQSSFQLDTVTVTLKHEYDLTAVRNSLTHNFTAVDQSAQNNCNPPQNRYDINYSTTSNSSSTAQLATKLATDEDYLSRFYGGGAVTKTFTSSVAGKATVTFKIASGYLTEAASGVYKTGDMVVNKIMKITANGIDVAFSDDLVLAGDSTTGTYACMANWSYVTFEMDVVVGENSIVLTSLYPTDDEGKLLYKDPGADGTQSSFQLDTVTVTLN